MSDPNQDTTSDYSSARGEARWEKAPRVSVVTCFHDRRAFAEASIYSVLDQTYEDYEVIVVDDCSTDGTGEVLASISDPKLKLIRNETNRGFVCSLLTAIGHASGEFVAVHGAGDLSYQCRLERQVEFLDTHPDHVAVGCHRDVLAPDGMIVSRTAPGDEPITRDSLLRKNVFSHGEAMYRRVAYDAVGGYRREMRYAQDYDLWLRLSRLGPLGVVQEVLYGRMAHDDGVSFDPERVAQQAAYSELARALAAGEIDDEEAALQSVIEPGIHSVVPLSNENVTAKLRKRVRVLVSIGRWDQAYRLAFGILEPGWASPFEVASVRLACAVGKWVDPAGRLTRRLLARLRA